MSINGHSIRSLSQAVALINRIRADKLRFSFKVSWQQLFLVVRCCKLLFVSQVINVAVACSFGRAKASKQTLRNLGSSPNLFERRSVLGNGT